MLEEQEDSSILMFLIDDENFTKMSYLTKTIEILSTAVRTSESHIVKSYYKSVTIILYIIYPWKNIFIFLNNLYNDQIWDWLIISMGAT